MIIDILNYIALALLFVGLFSILKDKFKIRDACFLSGTIFLTVAAFLNWLDIRTFEIFAFVLLFGLQVVANIFQLKLHNEKLKTTLLFVFSVILFVTFFLGGLFYESYFYLIAIGTVLAGFAYKEKPKHAFRQSLLLMIAAIFEILFAWFSVQYFYIYLNLVFIVFTILIMRKELRKKSVVVKH